MLLCVNVKNKLNVSKTANEQQQQQQNIKIWSAVSVVTSSIFYFSSFREMIFFYFVRINAACIWVCDIHA